MIPNKKHYVNSNGLITVQCPVCEKIRTLSVDSLRGKKNQVKIKCQCAAIFEIDIEFRKYYRKKVHFFGTYKYANDYSKQGKDCVIIDISVTGISLKITNDITVKNDDELIVNFKLDNSKKSEIEKTIIVRHVDRNNEIVGGEFLFSNIKSLDVDIYYYLLQTGE